MTTLLETMTAFCQLLRHHRFNLGNGELQDCLHALERLGLGNPQRSQTALRAICCTKLEDIALFNTLFHEFFFPQRQGTAQPRLPPEAKAAKPTDKPAQKNTPEPRDKLLQDPEQDQNFSGQNPKHTPTDQDDTADFRSRILRGMFSAVSLEPVAPVVPTDNLEPMLAAATELVKKLRLGRSRKWRSTPHGNRFDFRRTLRHSLGTGGEALQAYWLGHPKRNPRIVLLLDGSRSMQAHTAPMLQFAYALTQRSRRVDVFTFSTELEDITHHLRGRVLELPATLGAWGGGTKIGENLRRFLAEHAARILSPDTLVLISSDGLDTGDVSHLEYAMRELKRRSFGVIWLNPLASHHDFAPTARGMKAALPYLHKLTHASTPSEFSSLLD
jgi:uncharacterized protein